MASNVSRIAGKNALLAFAVSGALLAGTAAPALADTITSVDAGSNTASTSVMAEYDSSSVTGKVYSVDVTWNGMSSFKYGIAAGSTWDPETHTYSGGSVGTWTGTGTAKVVNHSNDAVTATASFASASGFSQVIGTFTGGDSNGSSDTLDTGEGRTPESADSVTFSLSLGGNGDALASVENPAQVGTATITITAA